MLKWTGATFLGAIGLIVVFLLAIDSTWTVPPEAQHRQDQCEELHVDSLVLEPQNTWSNVGYLLAGLLVLYRSGTLRGAAVGALLCVAAIASGLYHAVPTDYTLQKLDVASLYWVLLALIAYAILSLDVHFHAREPGLQVDRLLIASALVVGAIAAVVGLIDSKVAVAILAVVLVVFVVVGFLAPSRQLTPLSYREIGGYVMGMLMLGMFAAVCNLGDGEGHVLCDPRGPIQFHALSHLFGAALLLLGYDYFARVADLPGERILAD
jgi:hypothetical protein